MTPPLTLQDALDFMLRNEINDPKIYAFLSLPINPGGVNRWIQRIDKVNVMPRPKGESAKTWEGRKNRVRGRCFERLSGLVLQSVRPFTTWHSVQTTTNEIDWLVSIGPTGQYLPAMRQWGTHLICECKFTHSFVTVTWIDRLNTVLQTHNASVGILLCTKGLTNKGRGTAAMNQIRILSAMTPSRTIVTVNMDDIRGLAAGTNFVELLTERYVEARIGADRLRLVRP